MLNYLQEKYIRFIFANNLKQYSIMNTENNKIIAEFLGKEYKDNSIVIDYTQFSGVNPSGKVWQETKYHKDWNWLMEVVEKIESLGYSYSTYLSGNVRVVNFRSIIDYNLIGGTLQETNYNACVEFIKWYNEQSKV